MDPGISVDFADFEISDLGKFWWSSSVGSGDKTMTILGSWSRIVSRRGKAVDRLLGRLLLGCFLMVAWSEVGAVEPVTSAFKDHVNIALGRPYVLEPAPNYALCTDARDLKQLTDGELTTGVLWTSKGSVGWRGSRAFITIDLGAVQPIGSISYSTAAGFGGVQLPELIQVMVSDDGVSYSVAGDLVSLDARGGRPAEQGKYITHCFRADDLVVHGRFVKLGVEARGPYLFCDELIIGRGTPGLATKPSFAKESTDTLKLHKEAVTALHIRQRLKDDLASVRDLITDIAERGELERELADVESLISAVEAPLLDDFRTVFPLNDLHRRIFAVQASAWRAKGARPLTVWQKNCWDMLSPTEMPSVNGAAISLKMMRNEWRNAAFNISNAGTSISKVSLSIKGLPGGQNQNIISVYEVPFTDTKSGVAVAAALPEARRDGSNYIFNIEPGMTSQIWLTFYSVGLSAGDYTGTIVSEATGISVPVDLKIYPLDMPESLTLHLGGWDYTNSDAPLDVAEEVRPAFTKHLQKYHVDTPWALNTAMPTGEYDTNGAMTVAPDSTNFRAWVERWPNARNYYVFSNMGETFAGFGIGTPGFKRAVSEWINWWVQELNRLEIQPEQLGLLLVDEPRTPQQDRIIVEYGKVINGAQPKVVVWEDPTWSDPREANADMFAVSDVLCAQLPLWLSEGAVFSDFFVKQRTSGKELWFYSCEGPGKLLDPYSYFRMQHWFCWEHGAKGSCFWAFGDSAGASSWNEYVSSVGAYTPLFLDFTTVTNGKHMEAIREGMEDYEYLRMLQEGISKVRTKGVKGEALVAAETLLNSAAGRVTASTASKEDLEWKEPKDRSVADQVRVQILEALMSLNRL